MTIDQSDQKLRFKRIFQDATTRLSCENQVWPCHLIDISLDGCLLRFETPWQENFEKLYTLSLHLTDSTTISMQLSVSHVIDDTVAFKCEHIETDSINQLKRRIELELGDSSLLTRDFLALTELH